MKNTKRILAIVLSIAMLVGMIATVGAASTNAWYMPAVTYIENCGIDTIGTKDATPITRNDFVYWVAKIMTHQLDDEAWDESTIPDIIWFDDVTEDHHRAAIASSYQRKYIRGDGEGNFYPDDVVTLAEAAVVIVRMLGYEAFVTYDGNNWEYSFIEYASQKGIIDETFWNNTKTADPDYELCYGEAAYLLAKVMNYTATDQTPAGDLILTWDGVNLGDFFANSRVGKYKVTAIVTEMDYEWDDQDNDVSGYVAGFGVNYTTRIVDLDGLNSLGTNTSTAAGQRQTDKFGTVDATDVISDACTNLVCFFTDGTTKDYLVETLELQGFVRVSLGLDAEVGEDEEWELGDVIYNGTVMTVTFDKETDGIYSVEILDQLYVDTYIVATALSNKYVVGWTANERGSADYTMVLPSSYSTDDAVEVEATRYYADGTVADAELTVHGKTYKVAQQSLLESSMDDETIIVVDLMDVTTPLTAAEAVDAIPNTAEGEVSLVLSDINGDGAYDIAVVQENFWFSYRNYVNAVPASMGFAKSIPMGGVTIDVLTQPSVSVSTDPYTVNTSKKTNKVHLVVVPTNDRYVYQYGSYGAGENAYDGVYCLPAYKVLDLMTLKTAYIQSATALATNGFYEVVLVNTDGSTTTAYVPMPGATEVTYVDENDVEHTVYKTVRGELVYNSADDADVVLSGDNITVDNWYLVEDYKNGSFSGVAGDPVVLATSEVEVLVPYAVQTYVPTTQEFEIEIAGATTTVTLDSSYWNSFVTEYMFNEDTGINSAADRDDTAAWMVGHYVKYALNDNNETVVLIATEVKQESGLIVSVEKTNTGDNTFNVTMGVSGAINAGNIVSIIDTKWIGIRQPGWNCLFEQSGLGSFTATSLRGAQPEANVAKMTLRERCEILGIYDADTFFTSPIVTAAAGRARAILNNGLNVIYYAAQAGVTITGDETLSYLETLHASCATNINNMIDAFAGSGKTISKNLTLNEAINSIGGIDFSVAVYNYENNVENAKTWYTHYLACVYLINTTNIVGKAVQGFDKPAGTLPSGAGDYWVSSTVTKQGPTSVVKHEVRASASTVLWDYDNYMTYNTVFSQGRLVRETANSTSHLSGYDLVFGTFYSDAGKLYSLVVAPVTADYYDSTILNEGTVGVYISDQNLVGCNWDSKGLYQYDKVSQHEAVSYVDYTSLIVLETEYDQASKVENPDGSYTMNVNIKYAYLPYYLKIYAGNNIASYERRWTAVVDAVAVATFTPQYGPEYITYIPVVDHNGVQIEAKTQNEVTYWESKTEDDLGVPARYQVINGLVYKKNTARADFLRDDDGNIVYDVDYNTNLNVVKAAIEAGQVAADLNSADFKVNVNAVNGAAVSADVVTANYSDTVTVTVELEDTVYGVIDDVVVTYTDNGQTWTVSAKATETAGVYTFVMPAADVQVTALVSSNNQQQAAVYTYAATVADVATATVAITGDPTALEVGTTVTFTVTPDAGYGVESVIVTDADDNSVAKSVNNGVYSFTMPASPVTITVTTSAQSFYVTNVEVDVLIPDDEVVSLVSFRQMEQGETGWIPGGYEVKVDGKTFIAAGTRNVIVMTPDFTTGNVSGTVTTIAGLADAGKGLFYTKYVVTESGTAMNLFTVIGEICNADGGIGGGQVVNPGVQTTKVYLASGKSVITMDETGNYYYVTSTTSAVDFETKTVQIGAISVRYNTYVEAVYAATLKPVLEDGGTYYVDSENIVVSEG
jgi:hypothetical protein